MSAPAVRVTLDTLAPYITWRRPASVTPGETLVVRYSINEGSIVSASYTTDTANVYAATVFGDRIEIEIPEGEPTGEGTLSADVQDALGNIATQSLTIEARVCPEPDPPPGYPPGTGSGGTPGGRPGGGGQRPPPGTPPTPTLPIPIARARSLYDRWRSKRHIGDAKPVQRVFIRKAGFNQHPGDNFGNVNAICPALPAAVRNPWQHYLTPITPYRELDGVLEVSLNQDFEQNGLCTATIQVENTILEAATGPLGDYHTFERGYLSPWRGIRPRGLPKAGKANSWQRLLERQHQVTIVQGYGDAQLPVFTGLIDDVDGESRPDRITLTVRDFGGGLADRHIFGDNIGSSPSAGAGRMKEPLTFADRKWYEKQNLSGNTRYILIDDYSDMVKWLLRIAGFKEWEVESTGQGLKDKVVYNRSNTMMDIIKKACEMTNFVFYMMPPSGVDQTGDASDLDDVEIQDTNSIGVPVYRFNRALAEARRPLPLRDTELLTELQTKQSSEPIAMNIRVRGAQATKTQGGRLLGNEGVRRYMDFYPNPIARPSANPRSQLTDLGNLARGPNKHFVQHDELFKSTHDCEIATRQVAFAEALKSISGVAQTMGYPFITLDMQAVIFDTGGGMSTRVWISNLQSTFRTGEKTEWKMTLGGALIDTPEMLIARAELFDIIGKGPDPGPGFVTGHATASS